MASPYHSNILATSNQPIVWKGVYKMYFWGHARSPSDPDAINGILAALLSALEIPLPSGYPGFFESREGATPG